MELTFRKYQGTGNDFIMVDNRNNVFPTQQGLVSLLCDRKFGIGADGLILIEDHQELDYLMVYYNSDGSQSLCGNGSRCGYAFARELEMVGTHATFETTDGVHHIKKENGLIHFQLHDLDEAISSIAEDL
ncbi:MAG: diaminopimelate epimerase, partial [Bacteroidota bacterium]